MRSTGWEKEPVKPPGVSPPWHHLSHASFDVRLLSSLRLKRQYNNAMDLFYNQQTDDKHCIAVLAPFETFEFLVQ